MKNLARFYHRQRLVIGHSLQGGAVLKPDAGEQRDDVFVSVQAPALPIGLDRGPGDGRRRFNK